MPLTWLCRAGQCRFRRAPASAAAPPRGRHPRRGFFCPPRACAQLCALLHIAPGEDSPAAGCRRCCRAARRTGALALGRSSCGWYESEAPLAGWLVRAGRREAATGGGWRRGPRRRALERRNAAPAWRGPQRLAEPEALPCWRFPLAVCRLRWAGRAAALACFPYLLFGGALKPHLRHRQR